MRRSANELRVGEALRVGQEWAKAGDLEIWRVRQIHRIDCQVEFQRGNVRQRVGFGEVAKYWEPADPEVLAA